MLQDRYFVKHNGLNTLQQAGWQAFWSIGKSRSRSVYSQTTATAAQKQRERKTSCPIQAYISNCSCVLLFVSHVFCKRRMYASCPSTCLGGLGESVSQGTRDKARRRRGTRSTRYVWMLCRSIKTQSFAPLSCLSYLMHLIPLPTYLSTYI